MVIYKYPIEKITNSQTVMLPKSARILHINEQNNNLYLWAEVNPSNELESRTIRIYGTGNEVEGGIYINTLLRFGGHLVLHFYEEIK